VVTVDIDRLHDGTEGALPICYIQGSSVDPKTFDEVASVVAGRRAMLILDSAHSVDHVAAELELFAPIVSSGCYLICQDTFIGGHPVVVHDLDPQHGPEGPWPAVQSFVEAHPEFSIDHEREPMFTFCTDGYLLRS
jgi:cephalosporin hydroxylase